MREMQGLGTALEFADYLANGYWAETGWHSRNWKTAEVTYSISSEFSTDQSLAIGDALASWAEVARISFREVDDGAALRFVQGDDSKAWNLTASLRSGEIVWSVISIDTTPFYWRDLETKGGYGYFTLLHEIGHALGLGHPGNYNGSGTTLADRHLEHDTQQYSVMSYFSASLTGADHWGGASRYMPSTPLLYDILAVQQIYGQNTTTNAGDTVHRVADRAVSAIWDAGGTDLLDLSPHADNQRISLVEGSFSDVAGLRKNLAIAWGSKIENASGGAGDDVLTGNALDNRLDGGAGDDRITGGAGADTFVFREGHGNDTITDFAAGVDAIELTGAYDMLVDHAGVLLLGLQGSIRFEGPVDAYAVMDAISVAPRSAEQLSVRQVFDVAETGTITLDHVAQTVTLLRSYDNPVVIAHVATQNGAQPVNVRISDISGNDLTLQLQEPNHLDGWHVNETVNYLVVEAGTWILPDGTLMEAGTLESDRLSPQGFETVAFDAGFDAAPVVLSQVQTLNGGDFVTTRKRGLDADGFRLTMQEEEALNGGGHVTETLGWVALEAGGGTGGAVNWRAGSTSGVTDATATVDLGADFAGGANVIAALSSYNGPDPAWARGDGSTDTAFDVSVEEDTSADGETTHAAESVSYFAFDQAGVLEAYDYGFFL
jgi:hypothetical protein